MQASASNFSPAPSGVPWYRHRWPWLLMLGPAAVVLAGIVTIWLAYTRQDALVVDDYYKQGKAINQDLRRDRVAAALGLSARLHYDPASGRMVGSISGKQALPAETIQLRLIHSSLPEKDLQLQATTDGKGNFAIELPMLEQAVWRVQLEDEHRQWRLTGVWAWPHQQAIVLIPG